MSDLKSHKFIIIGGDNINSLGVLRSLAEARLEPEMIMVNERKPSFILNSRYAKIVHKSTSIEESLDILLAIYGKERNKPFVYTTDDNHEQLLDSHYEELKDTFYFFNAGTTGRISKYLNKNIQCDLARKTGFNVAPYEVVELGKVPQRVNYPVISKTLNPTMPGWKRDVHIFYNEKELKDAYQTMISPKFLMQEYIDKKNEMPIHGFSCNNGQCVFLAYYSLYYRMEKDTFGFYNYYRPVNNSSLEDKINRMIREIGFSGCFEIEFIVGDNDDLYFLEINLRPSMKNYACTYGGINIPLLWAQSMKENKICNDSIQLTKDFFTAMYEPGDYSQNVATKKISLKQWLGEMCKADVKFLYNKYDKKPAIKYWSNVIWEILRYKMKQLF